MPFVNELFNFINKVFVETGTFQGETVEKIINNSNLKLSKIISLELSDTFYENCKKKFEKFENISIVKTNSKIGLLNEIEKIDQKITFWLDSHYSCTDNVGYDPETICPVLFELDQIKNHPIKSHTIMVDDIRLMNNNKTTNKNNGFPVTKEEIIFKIYDINAKYLIKYFDDYTSSKDILVAFIEDEKYCVSKYLTKCEINEQPPGIADFLRGTIALYNFSKIYHYKLYIEESHPIFEFLKPNEHFVITNPNEKVIELIPPLSYQDIYLTLENLFKQGKTFEILTNSFYDNKENNLSNFGEITEDCRNFLKNILLPTSNIENKINYLLNDLYKINLSNGFKIIHLRSGDKFLNNDYFDENIYNFFYNKITNLINQTKNVSYILLSDSSIIANKLKTHFPELHYYDSSKVHLGDLKNSSSNKIFDTLVDFFIMTKSNEIISNGSGFSTIISVIYDIKHRFF